jgi:hypothetical protein
VTGLILGRNYSFMHSAMNNYGNNPNSSSIYIRPGSVPEITGSPIVGQLKESIIIDWKNKFNSSFTENNF